jgi:hypothetical protein
MTWLVKTRFGGSSWLGGDTGKVRYAPDIGSFSPAGEEYWGGRGNFFKFLAREPLGPQQFASRQPFYSETALSLKRDMGVEKSGGKPCQTTAMLITSDCWIKAYAQLLAAPKGLA